MTHALMDMATPSDGEMSFDYGDMAARRFLGPYSELEEAGTLQNCHFILY
ncbi:MAG: hypothetical protein ACQESR_27555 [Planctomycetota bacterium]